MVDTLWLTLTDPVFRREHSLTFQPRPLEGGVRPVGREAVLSFSDGTTQAVGRKFYFNSPAPVPFELSGDYRGAVVKFSIPKVWAEGRDNVNPVTADQAAACVERVANEVDKAGVVCDLLNGQGVRLDLFSTADSKYSFKEYEQLFGCLCFDKQPDRREYGGVGFLVGNSQRQTCIYDKRAEILHNGGDVSGLPDNPIRWEYRLRTAPAVKRVLAGRRRVSDILRCWDVLPSLYRGEVEKRLGWFVNSDKGGEVASITCLADNYREYKQRGSSRRYNFYHWATHFSYSQLVQLTGGVGGVREVLRLAGDSERQIRRYLGRVREEYQTWLPFEQGKVGLRELAEHLYYKLVA